jgi:hypothetical protein
MDSGKAEWLEHLLVALEVCGSNSIGYSLFSRQEGKHIKKTKLELVKYV